MKVAAVAILLSTILVVVYGQQGTTSSPNSSRTAAAARAATTTGSTTTAAASPATVTVTTARAPASPATATARPTPAAAVSQSSSTTTTTTTSATTAAAASPATVTVSSARAPSSPATATARPTPVAAVSQSSSTTTTATTSATTAAAADGPVSRRPSSRRDRLFDRKRGQYGPKGVLIDFTVQNCYEGRASYVADKGNLCWYWQCVQDKTGTYDLVPRRCALGSKMPYEYRSGKNNPCLTNFNSQVDYDCTRADDKIVFNQEPECLYQLQCQNGGRPTYEGYICWCDCPEQWRGAADCSRRTGQPVEGAEGGEDNRNCNNDVPPCDLANGCENGGTCHNLCKDFWCECPVPFTAGKRCESFDCVQNGCQNGGTCDRGEGNKDEVNSCTCPQGYSGLLCEIRNSANN